MTLLNQGLISSQAPGTGLTLNPASLTNTGTLAASNGGTLSVPTSTAISNYDLATQTLAGGTWVASSGTAQSALVLNRTGNIVINAADITLNGAGSVFQTGMTAGATLDSTLTTNSGALRLLGGRNYTAPGTFTSSGILELGGGAFTAPTLTNTATGQVLGFGTINGSVDNPGRVSAQGGVLTLSNAVTQYAGSTLTGGTWVVLDNATLAIPSPANDLQTNNADVTLSGPNSTFARINPLTTNNGAFRLLANRNFAAMGAFTNNGLLQLGGGTFGAPTIANPPGGEIFGFGAISVRPANSGAVRAAGGTLSFANGIQGPGGTVQVDGGAALDVSGGASGSSAATLAVNSTVAGSLNLGANNFVVSGDYTNAGFGSGNTFAPRANVVGTGQIMAAGSLVQTVTGDVTGGTTGTPTLVSFGNLHVGTAATRLYQINNVGGSGSSLRGAIQTTVNGGNISDTRLSGSGVTPSNFGPLAPGANSGDRAVTFTATSAGALTGQTVRLLNNFDNVGDQTLSISGAAYRYASPLHAPEPVNFGNVRLGASAPVQTVSLNNNVPNDGFSEALDAAIGGATTGFTSNAGSIALLSAGATNSSALTVSMNTNSVGVKNGTATLTFTSNGSGTSGLGTTPLTAQTVNLTGAVYRLASASAHTPEPVAFGNRHVGDVAQQFTAVSNNAAADGFSESLDATIGSATGGATGAGAFSQLIPGATNSSALAVGIDTSTAGNKNGTVGLSFASNGVGSSNLGLTSLASQTVSVTGSVFRLAQASVPSAVDFGRVHVGASAPSQNVGITNSAPNDGFSEKLDGSDRKSQQWGDDECRNLLAASCRRDQHYGLGSGHRYEHRWLKKRHRHDHPDEQWHRHERSWSDDAARTDGECPRLRLFRFGGLERQWLRHLERGWKLADSGRNSRLG